jgi:WD40 repeat protein
MRKTLRCSKTGLQDVDRRRRKRRWKKQATIWAETAFVSLPTLKRFWSRTPIRAESFIAIVEAVGIRNWRTVAEADRDFQQAPELGDFFGRDEDRQQLQNLIGEGTRAIALLGMGGLGKTALALKVAQEDVADRFDFAIWRSLREAPPLLDLLSAVIRRLDEMSGDKSEEACFHNESLALDLLFNRYLSPARCLLVLDNAESLLQPKRLTGEFRPGYEAYAEFFERIARQPHQSCILLTSRELPTVFERLSHDFPIINFPLSGLQRDARQILRERQAVGTDAECDRLIDYYRGNPKALQIASSYIRLVFDGSIADFFEITPTTGTLPDFQHLLDEHFQRLSDTERQILDWLAIEREPVTLEQLQADLTLPHRVNPLHALAQLRSKSLIERVQSDRTYTLQNAIAEYTLEKLIERFVKILRGDPDNLETLGESEKLLSTHALLKAQAPRYVRLAQERAIAQPLLDTLIEAFGDRTAVIRHLHRWIERLRHVNLPPYSYAAGNLINLLRLLNFSLAYRDLSHLLIRQVYWRESTLSDLNLRHAHLQDCVFPQTIDSILCLALSPDGHLLAIGDSSGTLRLWELNTGTLIAVETAAHSSWIRCLAFSPDGQYLASGSSDASIRVWQIGSTRTLEYCQSLEGHRQQIWSIAWLPETPYLVSASDDGTLRIWNYRNACCKKVLSGHTGLVRFVGAEPDGCHIVSAAMPSQEVWRWNVKTGETIQRWQQTDHKARAIALSPNGYLLATGSDDGDCAVRIYDLRQGMERPIQMLCGHTNRVWSVAFNSDNSLLASGSSDRTAIVWNVNTGHRLRTLIEEVGRVRVLAFGGKSPQLAAGSDDRGVVLWNYATAETIRALQGCTYRIWTLAIRADGQQFWSGGDDGTIRTWNRHDNRLVQTFIGHQARIRHLSLSPDARLLVSCSNDCTVRLWDIREESCLRVLRGHRDWVWLTQFLNNRQLLTGSDDRTLKIWDVETGRCLQTLSLGKSWVWSMLWCDRTQRLIAATEQQGIQVFTLPSGTGDDSLPKPVLQLDAGNVRAIARTPDGQRLVSGDDEGELKLWDLTSGCCLQTWQRLQKSRIRALTIDASGQWLACGGDDAEVELWNLSRGTCDRILSGHSKPIWTMAFAPCGTELMSAGEDETIRIWTLGETPNGQTLTAPRLCQNLDLTDATGLTVAQRRNLAQLGAIAPER